MSDSLLDLEGSSDDVAAHAAAPAAQVVGDVEGVIGGRFLDAHVMRGEDAGGDADDGGPGLAVVAAEGEVSAVPGEFRVLPAEFLRDAHAEGCDEEAAAEFD